MRQTFFRFLFYAVCMSATAYLLLFLSRGGVLWLHVSMSGVSTSEFSPLEQLQHACLAACIIIFLWIASRDRLRRPMAVGWATLFGLFLIRELDYVFDQMLVDNLWQVICAVLLALSGVYLFRHRHRFAMGWRRSWPSAGLGMVLAGLLLLIPFTQIVVSSELWSVVMEGGYQQAVKVAAEELMELGSYLIILIGSVEFLYSWSRLPQTKLIGALPKQHPRKQATKKRS